MKTLLTISIRLFIGLSVLFVSSASVAESTTLQSLLAKKVFSLDRSLLTFRYESRAVQFRSVDELVARTKAQTHAFFNPAINTGDMAGPGLYVAVDPFVTRAQFGGVTPQLFVIQIKKGAKIFDTRDDFTGADRVAFHNITRALHCFDDGNLSAELTSLRKSPSAACREATMTALKNLGVEAILYSYEGATRLQGCRRTRENAFNIIAESALDPSAMAHYADTSETGNDLSTKKFIAALYNESSTDPRVARVWNRDITLPKSFSRLEEAGPLFYSQWKAQNIWKCGPQRAHEAANIDTARQSFFELTEADGYLELLRATEVAYAKKTSSSFMLKTLRAIVRRQFQLTGLAANEKTFNDWMTARGLAQENFFWFRTETPDFKNLFEKMATLLDEPVQPAEKVRVYSAWQERLSDELAGNKVNLFGEQAGQWTAAMEDAGFGPRFTQLATEQMFVDFPLIVGTPPKRGTDAKWFFDENRRALISLLSSCKAQYQDPAVTVKDMMQGPCGPQTFYEP